MSYIYSWFTSRPTVSTIDINTLPNTSLAAISTPASISLPSESQAKIEEAHSIRFPDKVKILIDKSEGNSSEIINLLKCEYSERVISEVISRYQLQSLEKWTHSHVLMILAGLSVRVSLQDLPSNLTDDAQLKQILDEKRGILDPDHLFDLVNIPENVRKIFLEKNVLSEVQLQLFEEDRKLLKTISKWKELYHEDFPGNATAEYLSRWVAYFSFSEGMLIPSRQGKAEQVCFLEVKKSLNENGLAYLILEKVYKRDEVFILFRGTDSTNESFRHNFADVSGLEIFKEYSKTIFEEHLIHTLRENPHERIRLNVHGHSQGAALSQHFCHQLAAGLVKTQSEPSLWHKIHKLEMNVFNPPGVTKEQSDEFALCLERLEHHPLTKNMFFSLVYHIVDWDPVNLCGSSLLGHNRKTKNINVVAYTYMPPDKGLLVGTHCSPIFKADTKPVITYVYKDERDVELQIERQLKYLVYFQTKKIATYKLAEELPANANQDLIETVIKLSELSIENLNILAQSQSIPEEWLKLTQMESSKFHSIVDLIRVIKNLDESAELFVDFKIENCEWCQQIEKMDEAKVEEFIQYLSITVEEHMEKNKNRRAELDFKLNGTSSETLKTLDRITIGAFLKFEKDCLFKITNKNLAVWKKVNYGSQMVLVPVAIGVGLGVAIAKAPIVLAIAATAGGISSMIKKLFSWRSSTPQSNNLNA